MNTYIVIMHEKNRNYLLNKRLVDIYLIIKIQYYIIISSVS